MRTYTPSSSTVTENPRAHAEQQVDALFGLVVHWLVYLVVNAALVVSAGELGSGAVRMAGWGAGLLLHTASVLIDVEALRERLVQRRLS